MSLATTATGGHRGDMLAGVDCTQRKTLSVYGVLKKSSGRFIVKYYLLLVGGDRVAWP